MTNLEEWMKKTGNKESETNKHKKRKSDRETTGKIERMSGREKRELLKIREQKNLMHS